jgi:hypothetical protein
MYQSVVNQLNANLSFRCGLDKISEDIRIYFILEDNNIITFNTFTVYSDENIDIINFDNILNFTTRRYNIMYKIINQAMINDKGCNLMLEDLIEF